VASTHIHPEICLVLALCRRIGGFSPINWKNRQELEYSLIGTQFPPKISLRTLYTVPTNFLNFSKGFMQLGPKNT
jgi:hypothetical protein